MLFFIVSVVKLFRNNNKNNFASKSCKFLANLCKSSEILEQCHVKWWLKYRNNISLMEIKLYMELVFKGSIQLEYLKLLNENITCKLRPEHILCKVIWSRLSGFIQNDSGQFRILKKIEKEIPSQKPWSFCKISYCVLQTRWYQYYPYYVYQSKTLSNWLKFDF